MKKFRTIYLTITPYGKVETIESRLGWTTIVSDSESLNGAHKSGTLFEARAVHHELVGKVWQAGQIKQLATKHS